MTGEVGVIDKGFGLEGALGGGLGGFFTTGLGTGLGWGLAIIGGTLGIGFGSGFLVASACLGTGVGLGVGVSGFLASSILFLLCSSSGDFFLKLPEALPSKVDGLAYLTPILTFCGSSTALVETGLQIMTATNNSKWTANEAITKARKFRSLGLNSSMNPKLVRR